ncbi:MAG: hypothetical protein AAGB27_07005 [Pseudomonadota bacterium]
MDPSESDQASTERRNLWRGLGAALVLVLVVAVAVHSKTANYLELEVEATAYNSLPSQTTAENADLAAWGDRLKPGMKAIAVSRDLLDMGLGHGSTVTIDALPGKWQVLDKMNRRWTRKIDIYMGEDVEAARTWGRRKVTIRFRPQSEEP